MRLTRIEIKNYRSIEKQVEDPVDLASVTCLVGKNNAGKSNILQAVEFLIDGGSLDESDYFQHDLSREIEVRGYFEVEESDFARLKIETKRDLPPFFVPLSVRV